jgi:hypothetical protein
VRGALVELREARWLRSNHKKHLWLAAVSQVVSALVLEMKICFSPEKATADSASGH